MPLPDHPAAEAQRATGTTTSCIGGLLTPEQLISVWEITDAQYQELLQSGLPTIQFQDGEIRHPEEGVRHWLSTRFSSDLDALMAQIRRIADYFDPPLSTSPAPKQEVDAQADGNKVADVLHGDEIYYTVKDAEAYLGG